MDRTERLTLSLSYPIQALVMLSLYQKSFPWQRSLCPPCCLWHCAHWDFRAQSRGHHLAPWFVGLKERGAPSPSVLSVNLLHFSADTSFRKSLPSLPEGTFTSLARQCFNSTFPIQHVLLAFIGDLPHDLYALSGFSMWLAQLYDLHGTLHIIDIQNISAEWVNFGPLGFSYYIPWRAGWAVSSAGSPARAAMYCMGSGFCSLLNFFPLTAKILPLYFKPSIMQICTAIL